MDIVTKISKSGSTIYDYSYCNVLTSRIQQNTYTTMCKMDHIHSTKRLHSDTRNNMCLLLKQQRGYHHQQIIVAFKPNNSIAFDA